LKLKGALKKDKLKFDHIILTEDKNIISIENLQLSKDFKIDELETINLNFEDKSKLKNELKLKKIRMYTLSQEQVLTLIIL
jgi:hypothetical protein